MKKNPIRILLADDHKLFRKALGRLILNFNFATDLVEAANGKEAIDVLLSNPVDIVLMDIQMPVLSGMEAMKRIRDMNLKTRVIVLTQFDEQSLMIYLFQLGVNGFLLKDCEPSELETAIVRVMKEGHYYNDMALRAIGESISNRKGLVNLEISQREFQVMVLLKEGNSNKEIARILNLTLRTIESYRKALMKKTNCRSAAEVISLAYRTGIVSR